MALERQEVAKEHVWNVESMYPTFADWQVEFLEAKQKKKWPKESDASVVTSPQSLKLFLDNLFRLERSLDKLYTYAHLRFDEDLSHDAHKKAFQEMQTLYMDFIEAISWLNPALLDLSEKEFSTLVQSKELSRYTIFLQKIYRMKPHTLSAKEEKLLALAEKPLSSLSMSYRAMNNVDLAFENAVDQNGKKLPLSQGTYIGYLRSSDRVLRASAYKRFLGGYAKYENILSELLHGQVASDVFMAKAKNYPSSLDAALFPKNIDPSVYKTLIHTVKKHLKGMLKYISLRKRVLGLDNLYTYDLYVPLVQYHGFSMDYQASRDVVVRSVAPLGSQYQNRLRKGLFDERWVDVEQTKNKVSGAYSGGCYDSYPYILLNNRQDLDSVFTLAHEAGHSMHSEKSRQAQDYLYAQYPIFLAEVASTFNEQLLLRSLLDQAKTLEEKAYLIGYAIDAIRGTLFRQTLFADFELTMHEYVENGRPLTPQTLRQEYRKLNAEYYGPDLTLDPYIEVEYLRVPHFFRSFYVYQYATGISAALSLFNGVMENPEEKRQPYLDFLSAGSSAFPLDLLEKAGVDMTTKDPIVSALRYFDALVEELEALLEKMGALPVSS